MFGSAQWVLAVDPGKTTGWALARMSAGEYVVERWGQIGPAEFGVDEASYRKVAETLGGLVGVGAREACTLVIEDFILMPVGKRGLSAGRDGISPVRVTSWLLAVGGAMGGWQQVVRQQPSECKWGLSHVGDGLRRVRGVHAKDAVAHAWVYGKKRGWKCSIGVQVS